MKLLASEYATYRQEIRDYFISRVLTKPMVVLDPMAGTAPLIPDFEKGKHRAYLNDILPVHLYVNWLRTFNGFSCYRELGAPLLRQQLLTCMSTLRGKELSISDKWLADDILEGLTRAWKWTEEFEDKTQRFLKGIIVLCVRPLASVTKSSNPTWFKSGGVSSMMQLSEVIDSRLQIIQDYYADVYGAGNDVQNEYCTLMSQDAEILAINQKVDVILTSPPYCNRLDLIVQYGPELYFLEKVTCMPPNERLIATTRVRDYTAFDMEKQFLFSHSKYAAQILAQIEKASKSGEGHYYERYYTQYFYKLFINLSNVLGYLLPEGKAYLVLQDNTHRGILIETDRVIRELLSSYGWHSRIVKKWERSHLGLKNVSRDSAYIKSRQFEKIECLWRG